jgi:hypothetical protein
MRSHRLVLVATAVAATLACDEVAPAGPTWGSDDPDAGDDPSVDSGDPPEEDPEGPGAARNNPPRASAGQDQRGVLQDSAVTISAAGSSDIDGDPLTFSWELSKPAGSTASILNPTEAEIQFFADRPGDYEATVTVSDGRATARDSVRVQVISDNTPPRANAGFDATVTLGTNVQLIGTGSSDADGDPLEYYWTLSSPPGSVAVLSGIAIPSTAATPTFVADVAGVFQASLEVSDGQVRSAPDVVAIVVTNPGGGGSGGGTTTGGSSGSDCGGCAAQAEQVAVSAWTAGDLASGFGLLVFPVFVTLWQRRRED